MNDLISRQAAIRWVKTECNPYGNPTLDFESGKKVIEHLEQMPSARSDQRWIPVTERCPEIGQIVLCLLKTRHYYGRIHVCKYCAADKYYDHPYFDWGHNGFPDVVAWMPLPEPYREDEE